ncbi:protein dispatched homolog 3-like isoform X2 [Anneissia japonica]|uniref:protein dispatched homolog 3-like isoform X2 n=1 Tax=Anneissia japonica TaxID=1529436 RepID=UPI0014257C51|nr:protein dispatched homolog 3-like isoform X2 [Anneissia japonica]
MSRLQFNFQPTNFDLDYDEEPTFRYEASSVQSESTTSTASSETSTSEDDILNEDVFQGFQNTRGSLWGGFNFKMSSRRPNLEYKIKLGRVWKFLGQLFVSMPVGILVIVISFCLPATLMGISVLYIKPVPHFDISLDAFEIPNHVTSQRQEALNLAKKEMVTSLANFKKTNGNNKARRSRRSMGGSAIERTADNYLLNSRQQRDVLTFQTRSSLWRMEVVFVARGDDDLNIFTEERLLTIHDIEMKIINQKDFTRFCSRSLSARKDPALAVIDYCSPLNSMMTYFFPSKTGNNIRYDGMGTELADIEGALEKAMSSEDVYYYVDQNMNSTNRRSSLLRTEVLFGEPIGESWDPILSKEEQKAEFHKFIITYIDLLETQSTSKVKVLYGGTEIFDYEVQSTLHHDLRLSIITLVLIVVVLLILTSFSLWLTTWGILSVLLSFCWAFALYRMVFMKTALGMLNAVSVFVVIGIGVDDVFVFMNTYRQASHLQEPALRMGYTIKTAGIATFFTSATTAGAFAANMASQIPAIHDFGLFMSLIVSFCWFTVVTIMPSALNLWGRYFLCESALLKKCSGGDGSSHLYRVLADHEQEQAVPSNGSVNSQADDSDIQMLNIEDDCIHQDLLDDDDVALIDVSTTSPVESSRGNQKDWAVSNLSKGLEVFLAQFVAEPVKRFRVWVIVGFLVILGVSMGLVLQIQPASQPPTFYSEDSNLQELMDLAYNLSSSNIHCSYCSGFYQSLPQVIPGSSPTKAPSDHGKKVATEVPSSAGVTHDVHRNVVTNFPHITLLKTANATSRATTTARKSAAVTYDAHRNVATNHSHITLLPTAKATSPATTTALKKTCYDIVCPNTQRCHMSEKSEPVCSCDFHCNTVGPEICASNGMTYTNECLFKQVKCEMNRKMTVVHIGKCVNESPNPPQYIPTFGPPLVPPGKNRDGSGEDENSSPGKGYNPCQGKSCGDAAQRPIVDSMAMVYVVFGIEGINNENKTNGKHVLDENKGEVIYTSSFNLLDGDTIQALCRICRELGTNQDLVSEGGAECFPSNMEDVVPPIGECNNLPAARLLKGQHSKSAIGIDKDKNPIWYTMAFESKIYMGKSSFLAYNDYLLWEAAIQEQVDKLSPTEAPQLGSMFQTCEYWQQVFMEIIGVTSAVYGLAFSLLVCIVAVVIFTGHIVLLFIVLMTIFGVILLVVAMFYLMGWQMGAVEAVSLSILVGSSVDYCVHLVEGYLMAGELAPASIKSDNKALRSWRTSQAISSIGVSIFSSALTTIIAAVPLCFTIIQPFSKFGKIVAMNTFLSILYTMTACAAFLSCFAPAKYKWSLKWFIVSSLIVIVLIGAGIGGLYGLHLKGVKIPGPSGSELF